MSNFQSILDAVDKYAEQTGIDLMENPFADKIKGCDTPDAILLLLQENMKAFKDFRDRNRKFVDCLSPVVRFIHTFSGPLGTVVGLVPGVQPAKLIFVCIDVLFTAVDGVGTSYDALLELFECIGNFLKRLHIYSEITLDPLMMDIVVKIMVELISILALAKKHINRGRLKQFAKKLLGDSEIETILKRLDRLTQEEARMTAAQILAVVQGLLNNMKVLMDGKETSMNAIRRTLVTMQDVANEINRMKRDQLQRHARSWISPPDPSKNHIIARRIHSGESAPVWFTRSHTFDKWNLMGGLLWIHGKPGSGKSILCSSIIEEAKLLQDAGLGLVAYYYFDFMDTAKQDARGMMSSLVSQLSAKSDVCYDILSGLYSKHDAGSHLPDDDALMQCLKDMLELPGQPPIYIVVDGLDECPDLSGAPSPRELVLDLIEELVGLHLPNLRICVTSRPEADIQEALGPLVSHSFSLHDESGQKQYIMDYISSAVQTDKKMKKWRAGDRESVIDTLSRRADGMFRWVFCQIAWLRDCFPPDIRRALEELPETLDATYKRTLLSIGAAKREYACRLFQCLAVSIRPLGVEELAEILAIRLDAGADSEYHSDWRPEDAKQAVLSACSSLIMIVDVDGSSVVQFSHFSVKEFLMSSRLANAAEQLSLYHILPHSAHAVLSRACLRFLLNLGYQVDKRAVEKRPFAIYAARYWVDHGKFEGVSSSIQDLVERLFDADGPYFATWLWIYDVDRPWKGSMVTAHPTPPETKPLYYAALCGLRIIVERLASTHPTDVNAWGGSYGTPLNVAFDKGEVEIALALLRNGANINALDRAGDSSLHRAARFGHRALVKSLLEYQADVNIQTGHRRSTPLHLAAQGGEQDVCRLLLEHGADVAIRDKDGWGSLHYASRHGHLGIVQDLLAHGADTNAQEEHLWTPLHVAAGAGCLEIVQSLVRHGAALEKTTVDQETPLHMASRAGNLDIACFLVEQGANTMSKDKGGDIPLHYASRNGHLGIVGMLIEVGVDVNFQNAADETPLHLASSDGNLEVVRFLIERGADVDCCDKAGWTPLHKAARNGHLDVLRLLLDHGTDIHAPNGNHETPLILASIGGHAEISHFLIEHQADVGSVSNGGRTSLHLASRDGHVDVVQLLLDHGAYVNAQDADLWSPLHLASANGHIKVAESLIERGAEVDVRNKDKKTPLDLASGNGELEVARLLVKCDSNVNSQDNEGSTPSHSAARNGHLSLVELLLDSGADVDIQNSSDKTLLDLAHESRKRDVTSFLAMRLENVCTVSSTPLGARSHNSLPKIVGLQLDGGESSDDEETEPESLHSTLKSGRLDMFQRILDRGANVDERDGLLLTPLQVASKDGTLEIAKTLIKYGADVNSRDTLGWTPLHRAARYGHVDVARLLLKNGADANAAQREDATALHIASTEGHFEIVQSLLEHGANVQIRNVYGRTSSQDALTFGFRKVAQLLSEYDIGGGTDATV